MSLNFMRVSKIAFIRQKKQLMEEYLAKQQEEKRIQKELLEKKEAERVYNNQAI